MTSLTVAAALFGAAAVPAQANDAMLDLLKILRDKGTISADDYELLVNASKADEEAIVDATNRVAKLEKSTSGLKAMAWAERIKIKGDMRFRYENAESSVDGVEQDRLRIRARLALEAKVNDDVNVGIRLATTGKDNGLGSATSTNESLDENFKTRNFGLDRAYIDWAPSALGGNNHFVFGKMAQPWVKVNDLVWDGDTNPEGVAYKGKFKLDGFTLIPSIGYYSLDDVGNKSFSEDSSLWHAQVAANIGKNYQLGLSYYEYMNANAAKGTPHSNEELVELFGSAKIPGTPLTAYASWVTNESDLATGDEDAYAIGVKAKVASWKLGYEWRDTGESALNYNFDNSDFQDRSEGHILKAAYEIDKNFSLGATYLLADSNINDEDLDIFQLDLKAKFK